MLRAVACAAWHTVRASQLGAKSRTRSGDQVGACWAQRVGSGRARCVMVRAGPVESVRGGGAAARVSLYIEYVRTLRAEESRRDRT
eukprot:6230014-Prymnesium_polylepis.1